MIDTIGDKFEEAKAAEAKKKSGEPDPTPAPTPTPTPTPTPVAKTEPGVEQTDEALKASIETETTGMAADAKKTWSQLRFAERDLKRQLKAALPAEKATELQTQIATLTAELTAAKAGKVTDPTDVQELKDKLAAAEARDLEREQDLAVAKVEKTDAFKNAVTKPMGQIDTVVARLAKKAGTTPEKLMAALSDTTEQQSDLLVEAAAGMNEVDKSTFFQLAPKISDINEKAETLRSQAAKALEKMESKSQAATTAAQQAAKTAREQAHTSKWSELRILVPDALDPIVGDDAETVAWNQAQTNAEKTAREMDYGALTPEVQAEWNGRAAAFPLLVGTVQSLSAQLAAEKTAREADLVELTKFRGAKPGADITVDPGKALAPKGGDFVSKTDAVFRKAGF